MCASVHTVISEVTVGPQINDMTKKSKNTAWAQAIWENFDLYSDSADV